MHYLNITKTLPEVTLYLKVEDYARNHTRDPFLEYDPFLDS